MKIELEIGLNAINSYKRLAYTPWYAIAELVDNSTQSFFNNEDILRSVSNPDERPLKVVIEYDRKADLLRVTDNAMGMSAAELQSAMRVATPPENTSGRSKYGMGLKTSASWIGNLWTVCTKKLGETTEYTVTVDVEKIATGKSDLNVLEKHDFSPDAHYTIIEIRKHNRKFHTKTLAKIGQYLSSIYRLDIKSNILTLVWDNKVLEWDELNDEMFLRARDESLYKKPINFEVEVEADEGVISKKVTGWVGILAEGSRSKAGFSILHSARVIKGWPEAWRPQSLFGQIQGSNDLVNQRLVGELHLDEFDVSHTKDDILWLGDEEELVDEKLGEVAGDYKEVAKSYRKHGEDERGPTEVAIRTAIDKLRKELHSPEIADLIVSDPLLPENLVEQVVEAVKGSVVGKQEETFSATIESLTIQGYVDEMSPNDPYLTIDTADPAKIIIIVNASHPHWNQLKGADGVLNYLRHCTYDGIAEARARDKQSKKVRVNPDTVKLIKDKLLRIPFEIEQNSIEDDDFIEDNSN